MMNSMASVRPTQNLAGTRNLSAIDADVAARVLGDAELMDEGHLDTLWTVDTGHFDARAIPAPGGRLYEGGLAPTLRGLDANGRVDWQEDASSNTLSVSPVVTPDGTAILSRVVALEAYAPDGSLLWRNDELGDALSLQCAVGAGPVPGETQCYVVDDRRLHALDARTGQEKWSKKLNPASLDDSLAVAPDGTVLVAERNNVIRAYSPDGHEKWRNDELQTKSRQTALSDVATGLEVGPDGTVYFGLREGPPARVRGGSLHAIGADGRSKWTQPLGAEPESYGSPSVDGHGIIYCGGGRDRDELRAYAPDGRLLWQKQVGAPLHVTGCPQGGVLVGIRGGDLHALSEDGDEQWTFRTGHILTRPSFGEHGEVYTGSEQTLYAIRYDRTDLETRTREALQSAVEATRTAPPPTIREDDGWLLINGIKVPRRETARST